MRVGSHTGAIPALGLQSKSFPVGLVMARWKLVTALAPHQVRPRRRKIVAVYRVRLADGRDGFVTLRETVRWSVTMEMDATQGTVRRLGR